MVLTAVVAVIVHGAEHCFACIKGQNHIFYMYSRDEEQIVLFLFMVDAIPTHIQMEAIGPLSAGFDDFGFN